jgi:diguanylate cyclase (GGDEF)-like protein
MDEKRYASGWMQACERTYALTFEQGVHLLGRETYDAVLMSLKLDDGEGLTAYLRVKAQAPQTPVILMAAGAEESLALSLVRQGAQDYILKSELDCRPLARALRCAIERNRLLVAQQSISLLDDLSTLYNERGLVHLGERHWNLAARYGLHVLSVVVEIDGLDRIRETLGGQERDIAVIETTELLRTAFGETDLLARTGPEKFETVMVVASAAEAEMKMLRVRRQLSNLVTLRMGWGSGSPSEGFTLDQLRSVASQSLCENKLVEHRAGRHL